MKVINEGRVADVIYVDFSKAFDKLSHGGLFQKIKMNGIHDDLVIWIPNWFIHRRQSCGGRAFVLAGGF